MFIHLGMISDQDERCSDLMGFELIVLGVENVALWNFREYCELSWAVETEMTQSWSHNLPLCPLSLL